MQKLKEIDESQYRADFEIMKGYIDFSSELLRLSLLAMGSFGALVLVKIKGEATHGVPEFLSQPGLFLASMIFFALCAGATLFHRFYASDSMSWLVTWLRAENEEREQRAEEQRTGLHKMLRFSKKALIFSEFLFGAGVLFFLAAILKLLAY